MQYPLYQEEQKQGPILLVVGDIFQAQQVKAMSGEVKGNETKGRLKPSQEPNSY